MGDFVSIGNLDHALPGTAQRDTPGAAACIALSIWNVLMPFSDSRVTARDDPREPGALEIHLGVRREKQRRCEAVYLTWSQPIARVTGTDVALLRGFER